MYFVQVPKILYFSLQVKQPLHHYMNKLWQRKMFSSAWDKDKILSHHKESNLRPLDQVNNIT